MEGLYYYKLNSPYLEDVTKNNKLTITEIDSNFITLKNADIKNLTYDSEIGTLFIDKNDGTQLTTNIDLSKFTSDFKIEFDKEGGVLKIYHDGTIDVVDDIVTKVNNVVEEVEVKIDISTDYTLNGKGVKSNPLSISSLEKTSKYKAVEKLINKIDGEELPSIEFLEKGKRYLTLEYSNEYGVLYDYQTVKKINDNLKDGWHVPSKNEWDDMLNAIEFCYEHRNHNSLICNEFLGYSAGKLLKTNNFWDDDFEGSIKYKGVDSYGMKVLPVGYAYDGDIASFFGKRSEFWTLTETDETDIYTKRFENDSNKVKQIAEEPTSYCSLRLVKEYNGENFYGIETIEGVNYESVLLPSLTNEFGYSIWLSSNYSSENNDYDFIHINYPTSDNIKRKYYVNEWDGFKWLKKPMDNGDSLIIVNAPNGKKNIEYYVIDNQLISIQEECENEILYLVEAERITRETKDVEIEQTFISFKNEINETINSLENDFNGNINVEILKISNYIDSEVNRAITKENEIENYLNAEIIRAKNAETNNANANIALSQTVEKNKTVIESALQAEKERAEVEESKLRNEISIISDDYLKKSDKEEINTHFEIVSDNFKRYVDNEIENVNKSVANEINNREIADNSVRDIVENEIQNRIESYEEINSIMSTISQTVEKNKSDIVLALQAEKERAEVEESKLRNEISIISDDYLKSYDKEEIIGKINEKITLKTNDSQTVVFINNGDESNVSLNAHVRVSEDKNNLLTINNDGLYVEKSALTYDKNTNKLNFNGNEIQLMTQKVIEEGYYENGNIILIVGEKDDESNETNDIIIPVSDLIKNLEVNEIENSKSPIKIILTNENNVNKIHAILNISTDNISPLKQDGDLIYVDNNASAYTAIYDNKILSIQDAFNEVIKSFTELVNISLTNSNTILQEINDRQTNDEALGYQIKNIDDKIGFNEEGKSVFDTITTTKMELTEAIEQASGYTYEQISVLAEELINQKLSNIKIDYGCFDIIN